MSIFYHLRVTLSFSKIKTHQMKYTLNVYGNSVDLVAKSLDTFAFRLLKDTLESSQKDLLEIRHEFFEDPYEGDLLQIHSALDNENLHFTLLDSQDNQILEFFRQDISSFEMWSVDENPFTCITLAPEEEQNIYFSSDLWKGGVISLVFESDKIPTPEDFSISFLEVETPNEDWSLVNGYYFRGSKIEPYDVLDSTGKGSSAELFENQ